MSDLDALLDQIFGRRGEHAGTGIEGAAWAALTETGLTRVGIPEPLGGSGGELTDAVTVTVKTAEAGLSVPVAETLFPLAHLAVLTGEPVPGGVVAVADSYGEPEVDVAWAPVADEIWVVGPAPGGGTAFTRLPSWSGEPVRNLAGEPRGLVAVKTDDARSLDARVREDIHLLGAFGSSCRLLGALRSCLRLTREHVLTREQFGKPLAAHQVVRHTLAWMLAEVAAVESAIGHAAGLLPPPGTAPDTPAAVAVAAAKIQAATSATRVARAAHQLHGAIGVTEEHPLHHFTTRLWAWRDEFGAATEWSGRLARLVQTSYGGDLWATLTAQS